MLAPGGAILGCPGGTNGDVVSGAKNGDVGLCGPGEKEDECAVSVNVLARDALLNEWYGLCPENSDRSGLSILGPSSDLVTLMAVGEPSFPGDVGDSLFGV